MLTGKALFNTLLAELNEMGLPGMSATLDEMYRSPDFLELDPLMAIATLVEPEYQKKMNKRIQSRLRSAHLRGCPQELTNCVDSAEREYLPRGITEALASLDFLFEILEKRCEINLSTIICSQREPASWSSMILNDEVSANAILKRATKHYTVVIKPNITD